MKMLIFLIFMALVIAGMVWAMRKSQAEADLARRQTMKRLKKQRNEAVTPQEHVVWPTIIRPVSGQQAAKTESKQGQPDEGAVIEEPSMTTIEYEPPEHLPA